MRLPHSVRGIVADLQQYALPLCDLFTDKTAAVAYLRQHGSALNPWLDNKNLHSGLFYYAFCCGGSEAARFPQPPYPCLRLPEALCRSLRRLSQRPDGCQHQQRLYRRG